MLMSRARSWAVGMPEMIWRNRRRWPCFSRVLLSVKSRSSTAHLTQHRLVLIGEPFEPSPNTHPRRRVRDKRGSHPTQDGHDGGLRQDPDPNPGRNSSMTDIIHPSTDNNHRADVTPRSFTRTAGTGNTPSRNQPVPGLPINALNTRPPRQIHTTEHTHYNVRTLTITQYSANCSEPQVVGVDVRADQRSCGVKRRVERRGPGFAVFGYAARNHDGPHHQDHNAPRSSLPIRLVPVK
jgi:hypothetical protein